MICLPHGTWWKRHSGDVCLKLLFVGLPTWGVDRDIKWKTVVANIVSCKSWPSHAYRASKQRYIIENSYDRDLPGGPVVKTQTFLCRGCRFDPWWGDWDPACSVVWPKKKKLQQQGYFCYFLISSQLLSKLEHLDHPFHWVFWSVMVLQIHLKSHQGHFIISAVACCGWT